MNRVHFVCAVPNDKATDDVEMAINAVDFNTSDYSLVTVPASEGQDGVTYLVRETPLADNPMNKLKTEMMIESIKRA